MQRLLSRAFIYILLFLVALAAFFPFYVMLISSTHNNYNITTQVNILPGNQFMANYTRLTANVNIWRGFLNSVIIAGSSVLVNLYFTSLTAYAFAKFRFKGRDLLFGIILVAMMIPGQIGVVGFFKQMNDLKLLNTYIPLIFPSMANCFGVFFFVQYLSGSLPDEIIEAAYMDGCKDLSIFHKIVMPIMAPALVTQGIMVFIGNWNSYLMPVIILRETQKQPLTVLIATIKSASVADYGAQYVGILISVIPLIVIFSFASSLILDKISVGSAIKG